MQKYNLLLAASLLSASLLSVFFMRHTIPNHPGFAAAILSMTGMQGATSSPQTDNNATTTPSVIEALQQLQDQGQRLASEVLDVRSQIEAANLKTILTRVLKRGDSGDDVKKLQTTLPTILGTTATLTTGFYGALTEKAVKAFQASAGLKGTGIFDTETRDALISSIQNQIGTGAAAFPPIDLSSVTDPQQNAQNLQDQISQLASELSGTETTIADLKNRVASLESEVSDLQSAISTTASSPSSLPSPAPAALPLAISGVQVASTSKTSAIITWSTNNPSTSEVDYSSNSSMPANQTAVVKDTSLVTSHKMTLSPLISGTTYYFRAISKDSANSTANSATTTFSTLH